jgi:hypothetical protein
MWRSVITGRLAVTLASSRFRLKLMPSSRRFPPPWTLDENNDACFIVRDKNGHFEFCRVRM